MDNTTVDYSKENLELLKTRVSHMMDINSYRGYTLEEYAEVAQVHKNTINTLADEFKMDLTKIAPFEFFNTLSVKTAPQPILKLVINNSYFTASLIVNNNKWI